MDAIQAVEKEDKRLKTKYENCQKNLTKYLDDLIEHVQRLKDDLMEGKETIFLRLFQQ